MNTILERLIAANKRLEEMAKKRSDVKPYNPNENKNNH